MRASESRLIGVHFARVHFACSFVSIQKRDHLQSIFAMVRALAIHQGGFSSIPIRTRRYILVEFVVLRGRLPVMFPTWHFLLRLRAIPNFGERQTSEQDTRSRARLGGHARLGRHDAGGACCNVRCSPRLARVPRVSRHPCISPAVLFFAEISLLEA